MSTLDETEAFCAMSLFLHHCADRAGDDLLLVLQETRMNPDGSAVDPATWAHWVSCVASVRSIRRSGSGSSLSPHRRARRALWTIRRPTQLPA